VPDERDKSADRQRKADIGLGSGLGREIDADERAKSRLHVGQEENEPIEAAPAFGRRPACAGRG